MVIGGLIWFNGSFRRGFNDKNTQPQDAEKLRKPRQASEVSSPTCQEFLIVTERYCYIDGPRMMKYENLTRRDLVEDM